MLMIDDHIYGVPNQSMARNLHEMKTQMILNAKIQPILIYSESKILNFSSYFRQFVRRTKRFGLGKMADSVFLCASMSEYNRYCSLKKTISHWLFSLNNKIRYISFDQSRKSAKHYSGNALFRNFSTERQKWQNTISPLTARFRFNHRLSGPTNGAGGKTKNPASRLYILCWRSARDLWA